MPRVSILIPAYNCGAWIDASIRSALAQTFTDREVIVVNDGSTDDTADRLRAWSDPSLRVITQPNRGLPAALNTAMDAARGEYIGFLDADDLWLPHKLARHVPFLDQHPTVDVSFSWIRAIDQNGGKLRMPCPRWRGAVSFEQLLADYMIRTMSAVVMRRSVVAPAGPVDSRLVRCVDFEFFLRVALLRPDNFHAIPEVLTLYRRHIGQRTVNWRLMDQGARHLLASIRPRAPEQTAAVERLASSNWERYCASLAYESGDFEQARQLMMTSLRKSPDLFVKDVRNWHMAATCVASLLLPKAVLFAMERMAGFDRSANRK